jgi:hypothetical protein
MNGAPSHAVVVVAMEIEGLNSDLQVNNACNPTLGFAAMNEPSKQDNVDAITSRTAFQS